MDIRDLPEISFEDLANGCPHLILASARKAIPLARVTTPYTEGELLMVSRSEDVLHVAENSATFLSSGHVQARRFGTGYTPESDRVYEEEGWPLHPALVWTDGAQHSRVRRLVDKVFTPAKVNRKIPAIQSFIQELISRFPAEGPIAFASEFSIQLPTMIITRELGLAPQHIPLVQRATDCVSYATDLASPRDAAVPAAKALTALQHALMERIDAFRQQPEENFLSDLVHAKLDDVPALSTDELMSTAILLLLGGSHTTSVMLSWAMYMLASRQDIQARLRGEPGKIPDFVEELLRFHGTVTAGYRTVAQDVELLGSRIPKGACVMMRWDSANRDETKFDRPQEFDIDRPNIRRHTAFGHGKHFCIGNGLARAELKETVSAMLDRFRAIDLVGNPDEIVPTHALDNHALAALTLELQRPS